MATATIEGLAFPEPPSDACLVPCVPRSGLRPANRGTCPLGAPADLFREQTALPLKETNWMAEGTMPAPPLYTAFFRNQPSPVKRGKRSVPLPELARALQVQQVARKAVRERR